MKTRGIISLITLGFCLLSFGDQILIMNFEYCVGEKRGTTYAPWPTGAYISLTKAQVDARGWNYSSQYSITVLGGQVDSVNFTPYTCVRYVGQNFWTTDPSALPIPPDYPYSGGSGPITSTSASGNVPYQGSSESLFSPYFESDTTGSPSDLVPSDTYYGRTQSGQYATYTVTQSDGQTYLTVTPAGESPGLAVPVDDPTSIPVYTVGADGTIVQSTWNPSTGAVSGGGSGDTGGGSGESGDSSSIVSAINSNGEALRQQLILQLGSAGESWVYQSKLDLDSLLALANGNGLRVNLGDNIVAKLDTIASKDLSVTVNPPAITVNPPAVTVNPPAVTVNPPEVTVNVDQDSVVSAVNSGNSQLSEINSKLGQVLNQVESLNTTPSGLSLPGPNFGNDSPDDNLPWDVSGFNESVSQSFGELVGWGDNGAPTGFRFDIVSGILNKMVGSIPSVGSDPDMFEVSFDIPFIGQVQKRFSFSDYPSIPLFRVCCLWACYVFFGLAVFKLLHKSII